VVLGCQAVECWLSGTENWIHSVSTIQIRRTAQILFPVQMVLQKDKFGQIWLSTNGYGLIYFSSGQNAV
jgi:hypothetical protein